MTGITSITFRTLEAEDIIAFARRCGLQGIEWGGDIHVPPGDIQRALKTGEQTRAAGLQVFSYGSYYRLGKKMDCRPVFESARALGTKRVRLWAGSRSSAKITEAERAELNREVQLAADTALSYGLEIGFEYHRNTLTDTKESALALIQDAGRENVYLYWQPNPEISRQERLSEIQLLRRHIKTVHAFWWTGFDTRHLLEEGRSEWLEYLKALDKSDVPLLLEFCKDDSLKNAEKDLAVLNQIWRAVYSFSA